MAVPEYDTFEGVKARLDEIVEAVGDDDLPLDVALDLYEEAVELGLAASRLMEEGIAEREDADVSPAPESHQAVPAPAFEGMAPVKD